MQHEVDHLDGILYPRRIRDLTQFGFNDALFPGEDSARRLSRARDQRFGQSRSIENDHAASLLAGIRVGKRTRRFIDA